MTLREAVMEYSKLEQQIAILRVQQDRLLAWIEGNKATRTSISQTGSKYKPYKKPTGTIVERIISVLESSDRPLMPVEIAEIGGIKNKVHAAIHVLTKSGKLVRTRDGYKLAA